MYIVDITYMSMMWSYPHYAALLCYHTCRNPTVQYLLYTPESGLCTMFYLNLFYFALNYFFISKKALFANSYNIAILKKRFVIV